MVERWGRVIVRHAAVVLILGIAALVGAGWFGADVFGSLSQGGFDDPDSESAQEYDVESEIFGNRNADVVAIYSSEDQEVTDPEFRRGVQQTLAGIPEDTTTQVLSYYDTRSPELVSDDRTATQ